MPKISRFALERIDKLHQQYKEDYPNISFSDLKHSDDLNRYRNSIISHIKTRVDEWSRLRKELQKSKDSEEDMVDVPAEKLEGLIGFIFIDCEPEPLKTIAELYKFATPDEQVVGATLASTALSELGYVVSRSALQSFSEFSEKMHGRNWATVQFAREYSKDMYGIKDFKDFINIPGFQRSAEGRQFLIAQKVLKNITVTQDLFIKMFDNASSKGSSKVLDKKVNGEPLLFKLLSTKGVNKRVLSNIIANNANPRIVDSKGNSLMYVALKRLIASSNVYEKSKFKTGKSFYLAKHDLQDAKENFQSLVRSGVEFDALAMHAMQEDEHGTEIVLHNLYTGLRLGDYGEEYYKNKAAFIRDTSIKDKLDAVDREREKVKNDLEKNIKNITIAGITSIAVDNIKNVLDIFTKKAAKVRRFAEDMQHKAGGQINAMVIKKLEDEKNEVIECAKKAIEVIESKKRNKEILGLEAVVMSVKDAMYKFIKQSSVSTFNLQYEEDMMVYRNRAARDKKIEDAMDKIAHCAVSNANKSMIDAAIKEHSKGVESALSEATPKKTLEMVAMIAEQNNRDDIAANAMRLALGNGENLASLMQMQESMDAKHLKMAQDDGLSDDMHLTLDDKNPSSALRLFRRDNSNLSTKHMK
ncbi:hypothetical protein CAXC1_80001 [Candidatus Xenohaliotis californiensis]|uniref:Uncharacterized protein n=1 Tax=Candidatus Xenohaliotis californiensis TaxID=84677 RepID=A0ABP0EU57_9RICK|nr:hypothetical protein CAXC1_80001 [Candidatus Xenohaliotis californiensis]